MNSECAFDHASASSFVSKNRSTKRTRFKAEKALKLGRRAETEGNVDACSSRWQFYNVHKISVDSDNKR